jgi:hypothetical protein
VGLLLHAPSPTYRTKVTLWSCSYATAKVSVRIIWPRKPHHHIQVTIP